MTFKDVFVKLSNNPRFRLISKGVLVYSGYVSDSYELSNTTWCKKIVKHFKDEVEEIRLDGNIIEILVKEE